MKKFKLFASLCVIVSLSLFIGGIYGYFTMITAAKTNTLTINDKTSYKVVHKTMDLNGSTYSTYLEQTYTGITLGTTVTPAPLTIAGFVTPSSQTVTLNSFNETVITYLYTRRQYDLTLTNTQYILSGSTPAGRYYYGTQIHLTAATDDGQGNNFIKWTNNNTNRDYTFELTEDTTLGPLYSLSYQVTYVKNNGDPNETITVSDGNPINYLPTLSDQHDCTGTSGDYIADQCTYVDKLVGWYTEPTFENQVNEQYTPTNNVTLYARWNRVFFYDDTEQFNGNSLLDTGMQLFNDINADKDFIVEFTIDAFNTSSASRSVFFANMDEVGEPYPGVQFRWYSSNYNVNANVKVGNKKNTAVSGVGVGSKIILKRENGVFSYSIDNGVTFVNYNDYSNFDLYFDSNATFGGEYDGNGNPYRYIKATLSDMHVEFIERPSYTIKYKPNGGTGMMLDQSVETGKTVTLNDNLYEMDHYIFKSWNTAADGSGTTYTNKQQISNLTTAGGVVTLYAQWDRVVYYYIHYDMNSGTGIQMPDQQMKMNKSDNLSASTYTKSGYVFWGWNTAADGSGTYYKDEAEVLNLTNVEDDIVTLYASYLRIAYENVGPANFDGTSATFIDTGVNPYSQTTVNKDFEIRFTVEYVDPDVGNQTQPTLMNCKDESNSKWPGFVVRINNDSINMLRIVHKWNNSGGSTTFDSVSTSHVPIEIIFRRVDKVVSVTYNYSGYTKTETVLYNQSNWTLNQYFVDNISFGGNYNSSHQPDRFFYGTLSNMRVLIED